MPWDLAVVINRTDRWDRLAHAMREFNQVGIEVVPFAATKWEDLHVDSAKNLTKKVPQHHNLLGHVACGLSHHAAMCWALNHGHNSLCIFEDDVELSDSFVSVLQNAINVLDRIDRSWQFLYLGYRPWKGHEIESIKPSLGIATHVYDAHAYVVRTPLLNSLITHWNPLKKTTDWFYQEDIACRRYAVIPQIAWQDKSIESDIDRPKKGGDLLESFDDLNED